MLSSRFRSVRRDYKVLGDEVLMDLIKKGDQSAFDELYQRYSRSLLHYFYRMLGRNEEKAQDFLQDLFLKVVEKPHLYDSKRKFSTWLFAVASNMCKNEYRRLQVRVKGSQYVADMNVTADDVVMPRIASHMDSKRFKELLYKEVDKLDAAKKDTFLLRYQEHLSIKEISEIMQVSEGTVKSRLFYTTKKLAEQLKAYRPVEY